MAWVDRDLVNQTQEQAKHEGRGAESHTVAYCKAVAGASEAQAAAVLANTTHKFLLLKD